MKLDFLTFKNKESIIEGVVLRQLIINRDPRGSLEETMREDWTDVFDKNQLPFAQSYYSETMPGIARDEDRWHVHNTKQVDRFLILHGSAVVALYDMREGSKTEGVLNLFSMGETNGDDDQFILLIPKKVLHTFCAVGSKPCGLLNFPTHLYDPSEEGRVPFTEAGVKFPDGTPFSWDEIRKNF